MPELTAEKPAVPSARDEIVERTPEGIILRRAEISRDEVLRAIALHRQVLAGRANGRVVKQAVKTKVTEIEWDGASGARRLCVKEFVRGGMRRLLPAWLRHRPAVISWRATAELQKRGIGAPVTLAAVLGPGASSFLVMQMVELSDHALSYIRKALNRTMPVARRRAFVRATADFLARCYRAGVFHHDLKATNLFVRERGEGWEFTLLDLAAVRFPGRVRLGDKLLNLSQLNASTSLELTWSDRLRLLRLLAADEPALRGRPALAELARMTRRRRCVWAR